MAELAATAEVLAKCGAWGIVAVMILVVRALYARGNQLQDKLMEFAMKSLEADKDTKAALDKVSDTSREMASAVNRLADKLMVRP